MRNIPMFVTENGAASLTLDQIPYRKAAYIQIRDSLNPKALLLECCEFCRAAGAEKVYASGNPVVEEYPLYTSVLLFSGNRRLLQETDFIAKSVTEEELDLWREIYNDRMKDVAGAAYMTMQMAQRYCKAGSGFTVINPDGELCGIGVVEKDTVSAVISLYKGMGADILSALCRYLPSERVLLEVSSSNVRAIRLYRRFGMECEGELSRLHEIFL
ncbi:MAG: GNAT family N-acetyltransferase [Oscillospiraceae bacterium]|nr:GNAT family N-acetyltransferase [Oscillospiraceae bacterium]